MLTILKSKEHEIMLFIWQNEDTGVAFSEIHNYVNGIGNPLARQTVNTYIQRLIQKKFVKAEGEERHKIYYPVIPKKDYDSALAKDVVDQLYDGSLQKFISALTGNRSLSEKEIKELKTILQKRG